jgi:hypothetical protein
VWFYDHDRDVWAASPADYLLPQAESLEGWLSAWRDGGDPMAAVRERQRHAEP